MEEEDGVWWGLYGEQLPAGGGLAKAADRTLMQGSPRGGIMDGKIWRVRVPWRFVAAEC